MSGKNMALMRGASDYALGNPGAEVVYLCPAKQEIVRFIWAEFGHILGDIDGVRFNSTNHQVGFPNGSRIRLMRDDDERRAYGLRFHKIVPDHRAWMGQFWRTREYGNATPPPTNTEGMK